MKNTTERVCGWRGGRYQTSLIGTLALAFAVCAIGGRAFAAACVEIDTTQDTLSEQDQRSAKIMLTNAIRNQGIPVATEGCDQAYRVYHVQLGQSVNVFLSGPQGTRQGQAGRVEELPAVYDQLVRSLISGVPVDTASSNMTRENVTTAQMAPKRANADSLWYLRLGYGGIVGPGTGGGPAFGFGYRYELDKIGIDMSFLNFVLNDADDDGDNSGGITGSWVKLMALYYFDPISNGSFYAGGGISWGGTAVNDGSDSLRLYSGSGLQGEIAAGYEFLRASTIRIFAQADVTLPFYLVDTFDGEDAYAATMALSVGLGWGRGINRVHVSTY